MSLPVSVLGTQKQTPTQIIHADDAVPPQHTSRCLFAYPYGQTPVCLAKAVSSCSLSTFSACMGSSTLVELTGTASCFMY